MNSYESQRLEKIKQNQALLAKLEIQRLVPATHEHKRDEQRVKRRKIVKDEAPSRSSARIAAAAVKQDYSDEKDGSAVISRQASMTKKRKPTGSPPEEGVSLQNDAQILPSAAVTEIKEGWTHWKPIVALPSRNEHQVFYFDDYPEFGPNKSPEEMLREGCFGGSYYRPLRSRKLGIVIKDDWEELPQDWIEGLSIERYIANPEYNPDVNKYKVSCGQSIEEWEAAGWINHDHDVRGWFQWYTRFFQGRRCDDDERQVSRWKKCVGETGRWRRMLLKKYMQMGVREVFDDGADEESTEVSPVMHQTCHHWAFELRQEHLDTFFERGGK